MQIEYKDGTIVITIPDNRVDYDIDTVSMDEIRAIAGESAASGLEASIAGVDSIPDVPTDAKAVIIRGNKAEILRHNQRTREGKFKAKLQRGLSLADEMFTITK